MSRSVIGNDFEKRETVPLLHPSKRKLERLRKVINMSLCQLSRIYHCVPVVFRLSKERLLVPSGSTCQLPR